MSCLVCAPAQPQLTKLAEQKINVIVGSLRVVRTQVSGPLYFRYQIGVMALLYDIADCLASDV
jgi:hypothetical protein